MPTKKAPKPATKTAPAKKAADKKPTSPAKPLKKGGVKPVIPSSK